MTFRAHGDMFLQLKKKPESSDVFKVSVREECARTAGEWKSRDCSWMLWNAGFTSREPIRIKELEEKCEPLIFPLLDLEFTSLQLRNVRSCALCRTTCTLYIHFSPALSWIHTWDFRNSLGTFVSVIHVVLKSVPKTSWSQEVCSHVCGQVRSALITNVFYQHIQWSPWNIYDEIEQTKPH